MLSVAVKKRFHERGRLAFSLDVTFEAGDGTTILVGASGSGKTTTLRAIAGIVTPDEGRIALGEHVYFDSATRTNVRIRRRRVGYVFQDYALFPHMTAEQNVAYGALAATRHERRERARELLQLFGIEHARGRRPHEMSGGEQQRTALARALASDPAVVLLDEPLSAVDVATRLRLLDEIEAAQRASAVPFIYVTHNHAEVERIGHHTIVLGEGRIVEERRADV